ncbi:MAG: hypothetical protein AB7J13_17225 [Pyrinomonadaceae bacterium]
MAAKITAFVLTLLINIAIGVAMFFFMLILMNGFSGSDAEPGLIAYVVLGLAVSLLMATGALLLTNFLIKKDMKGAVAALIAVPIFSIVGGALKVVCAFIGIGIAEYVRVNY